MCDDVFDQDGHDLNLINREYLKLNENIEKGGFQDGFEKGYNLTLQKAFDFGFNQSFHVFKSLSIIKGILSTIQVISGNLNHDLEPWSQVLKNLKKKLQENFVIDEECISNFNQVKLFLYNICQELNHHSLMKVIQECHLSAIE